MKKPSKDIIEAAIIKAFGNLTVASKSLKVTRKTIYEWIEKDGLDDVIEESRNGALDFVENKLMSRINEGSDTAIIFFLKTQGKSRGYIDKQEIDHNVTSNQLEVVVKRMDK